ncbi:MAG: hypothetical protein ACI4NM_08735, partial [Bullifex sp.]
MRSIREQYQTKISRSSQETAIHIIQTHKLPLIFTLNPEKKSAANIYSDLNSTKNLNDLPQKASMIYHKKPQ